ncbi:MAG: hypothetical protein RBR81_13420 [Bacteroidales bacterium]|jgi:hypothetical protein|nr:hypothetical protein [Bacteroidales bacterium]
MKKPIIFLMGIFLITGAFQSDDIKRIEISNKIISARLIPPLTKNGYYMGTRFDWSGMIESLEYKGHNYFGKWFDKYDPLIHDAIMGPVEEYFPLDYGKTPIGERFVKIGVGLLEKPDEKDFDRFGYYKITDHGKWKIRRKPGEIQFVHALSHKGYAYVYKKTIRLAEDRPLMEISHNLSNTGRLPIKTEMYNHNFFVFDNKPVGPAFKVIFPYEISGDESRTGGSLSELDGRMILFKRNLQDGETVFYGSLEGFSEDPGDLDIRVENSETFSGVRITGNRPLSKLIFWASPTTLCPETYVNLDIEPGDDFTWDFYYEFYTFDKH